MGIYRNIFLLKSRIINIRAFHLMGSKSVIAALTVCCEWGGPHVLIWCITVNIMFL